MKKVISNVEYDTESAELVCKYTEGEIGDPCGFEECLFRTEGGRYFLYFNGGKGSKYPKESIKRISAKRAEEFIKSNA